jgi:hypothetical protein
MFTEYAFHLFVEVCSWITTLIFQLHPNVALELVKLREYCYHRNLKGAFGQSPSIELQFDIPFLSGQIFLKCFKSSDGRALSIGTQYLSSNPRENTTGDAKSNRPYRVQSVLQSRRPRLTADKILHSLQLLLTTGFESA